MTFSANAAAAKAALADEDKKALTADELKEELERAYRPDAARIAAAVRRTLD